MKINDVIIFLIGASVGSVVTWKLIKDKYQKIADEEIESVVNRFKEKKKEEIIKNDDPQIVKNNYQKAEKELEKFIEPEPNDDYDEMIDDCEYVTIEDEDLEECVTPYVISPSEFAEKDNWDAITLIYYADYTLVEENGDYILNERELLGDCLKSLRSYEDEDGIAKLYVRNENLKCDYEIIKCDRPFDEITEEDL